MEPMERLALSWGKCARQFTKLLLSLLSHIGKLKLARRAETRRAKAGAPAGTRTLTLPLKRRRLCYSSSRSKMVIAHKHCEREGGVEPPQPGL